MHRLLAIFFAPALLVGSETSAWAQRTTATFAGIVVDASGGILPGVNVTLTNEGTGIVEEQVTSAVGEFVFNYVQPGSYTMVISITGFKTYAAKGLVLGAGQTVRRQFALEVGALEETVTVSGAAPLVDTASTEQRITLETTELAALPVANRNITNLLNIGAGLTRQEAQVEGGGIGGSGAGTIRLRLNGLGGEAMSITANGTDASGNSGTRSISSYTGVSKIDVVSMEAVAEVNIVKGILPAEFGNALAGNMNIITKAGTNAWHGSLFGRYEGAGLVAKPFFLEEKPSYTWNQGGGSMGGPLVRDRAFFFAAFEAYRLRRPQELNFQAPTQRMRDLLLTAMPFPETRLFLDQLPSPTEPLSSPTALLGTFIGPGDRVSTDDHVDVRADFRIKGGNLSTSLTYGHPYLESPTVPGAPTMFQATIWRAAASYSFSRNRWSSETRFGSNYNFLDRTNAGNYILDPVNPGPLLPVTAKNRRQIPVISFPGLRTFGNEANIRGHQPSYSVEQQLTRVTDRHSFKWGARWNDVRGGRESAESAVFSYLTEAELSANTPVSVLARPVYVQTRWNSPNWGVFLQDDWRVSSKLVVNLGVRYDYFGVLRVKGLDPEHPAGVLNLDGQPDPSFTFGPPRSPDSIGEDDKGINVGPRIGLAYNPDGRGNTVITSGWGLLFQGVSAQILESMQFGTTRGIRSLHSFSAADVRALGLRYPMYNEDFTQLLEAITTPGPLTSVGPLMDPQMQAPYAHVYTAGLQRMLSSATVINVAYLGTRGHQFRRLRTYNEVDRVTGLRPNPNLSQGSYLDDSQETTYNSLQTSIRQRLTQNLQFNVNYTWSFNRSNYDGDNASVSVNDEFETLQDFFADLNDPANWGPAIGDIRHNFIGDVVYRTPGGSSSSPLVRHLLGGYQLAAIFRVRSGEPLTVAQSGRAGARPDVLDAANAVNQDCCDLRSGNMQYLNRAAFQLVPLHPVSRQTIRPGNATLGQFRLPGFKNVDVSVGKQFSVGGARRLELRADILNAFNWINYVAVSRSLSTSNFGEVTGVGAARVAQVEARFSF
jgi:hypothetical protein